MRYTSCLFLTARTLPYHPKKISRIKCMEKNEDPWTVCCFFINFALGNRAGASAHLQRVLLVCGLAYHSLLLCLYCGTTVTLTDTTVVLRKGIFHLPVLWDKCDSIYRHHCLVKWGHNWSFSRRKNRWGTQIPLESHLSGTLIYQTSNIQYLGVSYVRPDWLLIHLVDNLEESSLLHAGIRETWHWSFVPTDPQFYIRTPPDLNGYLLLEI